MKYINVNDLPILDPQNFKIGFASDHHLYHVKILELQKNRDFKNVAHMNEEIVKAHNEKFDSRSIIFFLGDFALLGRNTNPKELKNLLDLMYSLNGKIFYIPGNHEEIMELLGNTFPWPILPQLSEIDVHDNSAPFRKRKIIMCHYALRVWNKSHRNSWHLHGHSHGGLKNDFGESFQKANKGYCMDVGIDTSGDYSPFLYPEIAEFMSTRTFLESDHHILQNEI